MSNDLFPTAQDTTTAPTDDTGTIPTATATASTSTSSEPSISKSHAATIQSLSTFLPSFSSTSQTTPRSLLHDPDTSSKISSLLKQSDSGAGDNNLCRWLYDTFQSSDPDLQFLVLSFLPLIAGLYLSRIPLHIPLAGFEAVLLALYGHETASRAGQSVTVNVPDLSNPSLYHETKASAVKSNASELNLAVLSSSLELHGTVRSTRRARIVGVALELYFTKIFEMPVESKIDFCEFCKVWAGQDVDEKTNAEKKEGSEKQGGKGRVPLPCELLQPVLRILGHCLLCPNQNKKLIDKADEACMCLYARSIHDVNPKAILATGSLVRLANTKPDPFDPTEIPKSRVIS